MSALSAHALFMAALQMCRLGLKRTKVMMLTLHKPLARRYMMLKRNQEGRRGSVLSLHETILIVKN